MTTKPPTMPSMPDLYFVTEVVLGMVIAVLLLVGIHYWRTGKPFYGLLWCSGSLFLVPFLMQ